MRPTFTKHKTIIAYAPQKFNLEFHFYQKNFFEDTSNNVLQACIATARASNVIGVGDYNISRLIPYVLESFKNEKTAMIRTLTFRQLEGYKTILPTNEYPISNYERNMVAGRCCNIDTYFNS